MRTFKWQETNPSDGTQTGLTPAVMKQATSIRERIAGRVGGTGALRVWSAEMAASHSDCGLSWSRRK